ncbi:MAG TPA: helix-turn-helix domain-containing protein [Chitinophagaceae bacterium]|jgi:excisionase family DNA binding protein|nr:helix-turn-helix domain-containing protein [Chitinophagaceae bacterium]
MENVHLFSVPQAELLAAFRRIVEEVLVEYTQKQLQIPPVPRDAPLLKVSEVCTLFQISKPTLYDWMKRGKIHSIKIRANRYFHWQDVEAIIRENRV